MVKKKLKKVFAEIDKEKQNLISVGTFFDELVKMEVQLSQRDILDIMRRYEKEKGRLPYMPIIKDLLYNHINHKWTVKPPATM